MTNCVALEVNDREKAKDFYQGVLGMKDAPASMHSDGEMPLVCGNTVFFLDENPGARTFFEFEVDDTAKAEALLVESGCKVTSRHSDTNMMFQDPYGMRFHVYQKGVEIVCG
jgi:catechol 2,3-dioxygenase-like lactoylglutathione lyase family enzyme